MDEEADAGDDGEHDEGEVVDGEGEVDLEAGDGDPRCWLTTWTGFGCARGLHGDPEPRDDGGGDGGADKRDGGDEGAGQLAAEGSVDEEASEGKQRDQPESQGERAWSS